MVDEDGGGEHTTPSGGDDGGMPVAATSQAPCYGKDEGRSVIHGKSSADLVTAPLEDGQRRRRHHHGYPHGFCQWLTLVTARRMEGGGGD